MSREQDMAALLTRWNAITTARAEGNYLLERLLMQAYHCPRSDYIMKYHVEDWARSWGMPETTPAKEIGANTDFVTLPWEDQSFSEWRGIRRA